MKKFLKATLIALTCLTVLLVGACSKNPQEQTKTLTIAVVDGAPVLTVYNMLQNDSLIDGYKTEVKIYSAADEVAANLKKGECDMAVIPTNVAGKLYNGGLDIKLLSTNIFGVLYMVGKTDLNNVSELVGKRVGLVGLGGTPDLTLKILMDKCGVEYVESQTAVEGKVALRYVTATDTAVLIQGLKAGTLDYAVLGEPAVTQCNDKAGTHVVFDLLKLWDENIAPDCYMQAGVVINKNVYEDSELVTNIEEALSQNYESLKANPQAIKETMRSAGSTIGVDFTQETVQRLNIGFRSAKDSKVGLERYFGEIIKKAPSFIDKLPSDEFYYKK